MRVNLRSSKNIYSEFLKRLYNENPTPSKIFDLIFPEAKKSKKKIKTSEKKQAKHEEAKQNKKQDFRFEADAEASIFANQELLKHTIDRGI